MTPAQLRDQIIGQSRDFFVLQNAPKAFIPGQTYIPVTTKVMDADDIVDGTVDFGDLTADAYTMRFDDGVGYWRSQLFRDGVPIAALGWLNPMIAGAAMALSSPERS